MSRIGNPMNPGHPVISYAKNHNFQILLPLGSRKKEGRMMQAKGILFPPIRGEQGTTCKAVSVSYGSIDTAMQFDLVVSISVVSKHQFHLKKN